MKIYSLLILIYFCLLTQHGSMGKVGRFGIFCRWWKGKDPNSTARQSEPSTQRRINTLEPPVYNLSLVPLHSKYPITLAVPHPFDFPRTFDSIRQINKELRSTTSQRACEVPLEDDPLQYDIGKRIERRLATDVFEATLKSKDKPKKVAIEISAKLHVFATLIENQTEIHLHLQKGLKVTADDGITHLIARGMATSIFIYQMDEPTRLQVTGPYIALDYYAYSVDNIWESSQNKIISGSQKMFSFRSVCILGLTLVNRVEALHRRDVAHGKLKFKSIRLKDKMPKDTSGDKVSDVVLADFSFATIFKDKKNNHVPYIQGKTEIYIQEETEYRDPNVIYGWPLTRRSDIYGLEKLTMKMLGGEVPVISGMDIHLLYKIEGQKTRTENLMTLDSNSIPNPDKNRKENLMQDLIQVYNDIPLTGEPDYSLLKSIYTKYLTTSELENIDIFDWYPQYTRPEPYNY